MKTIFLIIVIALGIIFFPLPSFASCAAPSPIGDEFENFVNADTVFIGTVIDIYNPHLEEHLGIQEYDTITFDVKRIIKGSIDEGKVITGHDSVGYRDFIMGKSYLVYAFGQLNSVGQCTPPILLSDPSSTLYYEIGHNLPYVIAFTIGGIFVSVIAARKIVNPH